MSPTLPASFHPDDGLTVEAANGGLIHGASANHGERFERKLWKVRDGVWCMVGNGLSNQTFVKGPGGLIAIDRDRLSWAAGKVRDLIEWLST